MDSAELNPNIRGLAVVSRNNAAHAKDIQQELSVHLPKVECVAPSSLEELHHVVQQSGGTAELVMAVGGDGTLHQVLNAFDPSRQILGILPMGTGNDFARQISFNGALADRVFQLSTLTPRPTDFGTVAGVRFINSAGLGLDSATLAYRRRMNPILARNYTLAFCCTLVGMQPVYGRVSAPGFQRHAQFWWLLAMNNQHIGGGSRIAPEARIDDGKLDLMLVDRIPKPAMLALMPRAIKGNHIGRAGVHYHQCERIKLSLDRPEQWLALDGELYPFEDLEAEFVCHHHGLRFLR